MKEIMIIVWPYMKSKKWYRTMVSKLICFFTDSNYTHTAIAIDDVVYESQVMNNTNGAMATNGYPPKERNCIYLEFKLALPTSEIKQIKYNLNRKVVEKRPYNFMKLFSLALLYPTKKLWKAIGWVPFSNEVFGSVCSVFVDKAFKEVGIDLIPNELEEYTIPNNILESSLLKTIS